VEELDNTLELLDSSYEEEDKNQTIYNLSLKSKVKSEPSLLSSFSFNKEEEEDDEDIKE